MINSNENFITLEEDSLLRLDGGLPVVPIIKIAVKIATVIFSSGALAGGCERVEDELKE